MTAGSLDGRAIPPVAYPGWLDLFAVEVEQLRRCCYSVAIRYPGFLSRHRAIAEEGLRDKDAQVRGRAVRLHVVQADQESLDVLGHHLSADSTLLTAVLESAFRSPLPAEVARLLERFRVSEQAIGLSGNQAARLERTIGRLAHHTARVHARSESTSGTHLAAVRDHGLRMAKQGYYFNAIVIQLSHSVLVYPDVEPTEPIVVPEPHGYRGLEWDTLRGIPEGVWKIGWGGERTDVAYAVPSVQRVEANVVDLGTTMAAALIVDEFASMWVARSIDELPRTVLLELEKIAERVGPPPHYRMEGWAGSMPAKENLEALVRWRQGR